MKKTFAFALLLTLSISLFAFTDSLLQFDTSLWLALDESVKCNREVEEVMDNYNRYIGQDLTSFERARAEYVLCRYYADRSDLEKAKEHMERQRAVLDEDPIESEVLRTIGEMDYSASRTYVEKNLSSGLENSNLTKKAFNDFPDEVYMTVVNAWRLIYTPQIAGGSNKNAIKILEPLLDKIETLSIGNRYSIYGALSMAHYNRKDYEEGMEYLEKAFSIYDGEIALLELKDKLRKKLK